MRYKLWIVAILVIFTLTSAQTAPFAQQSQKVKEILDRAIQALGGVPYLAVKDYSATGRYYVIEEDREGWTDFLDQTRLPSKSRQETGKRSDKETTIFDLDLGKGWIMYGDYEIKPATQQQIENFKLSAKHSLENLFRFRIKEPGVSVHYFGSDILNGRKPVQILELIDADNDTIRICFEESSGLPFRLEFQEFGKYGRKLRIFEEYSNWHMVQDVNTAMRVDRITNGDPSAQIFINKIAYNVNLPDSLFAEPTLPAKKKK
jgi:hypothetical protein